MAAVEVISTLRQSESLDFCASYRCAFENRLELSFKHEIILRIAIIWGISVRPSKNVWPDTAGSRGVLFFAQLMREMLTATTFESFRVYSLDTTARLKEALQLCDDIRRQRVPQAALEPIVEELVWSFGKDSAAKELAEPEIESLMRIMKEKRFSIESIASHIQLILKLTSRFYKEKIEEIILIKFDNPKNRIETRKLSGFYCSYLINLGYSRHHILSVVNDFFFSKDIQRIGRSTLSRFFREFDGKEKRFIILAAVTRDLGAYLQRLGYVIRLIEDLKDEEINTLQQNSSHENLPTVLEIQLSHLDPHGAMDACYQMLSAQRAIAYLDPYGMEVEWGSTMQVTRLRALDGVAITKGDFLSARKRTARGRLRVRTKTISNYARSIRENFDAPSTERLLSSIRTAALARSSGSPENQLISHWSAVEVLLSEPKDEARIVHYASIIVPCIVSRHSQRQVNAVYEELLIGHRTKFNRLLRSMPGYKETSPYRAFSQLMFLPEYADRRETLIAILRYNPLALHRVWKLHNDYRDMKSANRTISDHENRVRWQIHRVYRARNQLVHAGRTPSYLESVILNLAEYYQSSIATIVKRAKREDGNSDIDQIVAEIGIKYDISRISLNNRTNSSLNADQVEMIMDWL
ncbi:hypothetical protein [Aurantimonas sp. A3-2-R12]|uniref:hypothetical protein n=1 Tax=Aurantimonas sp. A3-2-R12 TaxID=3114362 RepID=UPI002E19089B|nr:hypothetical protein [Aurantimonas sp. A3-2-R12]